MNKTNKIKSVSNINVDIDMRLTEIEARALEALTVYGTQTFLDVFYRKLGKTYLQPHQSGLISLFETIKNEVPRHLEKIDKVRKLLK